eukprot:7937865-Lingulodinium_polyedra.AAC.3
MEEFVIRGILCVRMHVPLCRVLLHSCRDVSVACIVCRVATKQRSRRGGSGSSAMQGLSFARRPPVVFIWTAQVGVLGRAGELGRAAGRGQEGRLGQVAGHHGFLARRQRVAQAGRQWGFCRVPAGHVLSQGRGGP